MKRFRSYLPSLVALFVANLGLATAKVLLGYLDDSAALRAVGWNNAADFVYTVLLGAGLFVSFQPPDADHPEGHGRFESLIGFVVALIIIGTGLYVLYDAVVALFETHQPDFSQWAFLAIGVSIATKVAVGWFLLYQSNQLDSSVLQAIGYDQMADSLADLSVFGAWGATLIGYPIIDPLAGGVIGGLIVYLGVEPFNRHLSDLTGRAPDRDLRDEAEPGVEKTDHLTALSTLRAHRVGPATYLSVTVKAPGDTPLQDVHEAEEALQDHLGEIDDVERVFVHVEPPGVNSPT